MFYHLNTLQRIRGGRGSLPAPAPRGTRPCRLGWKLALEQNGFHCDTKHTHLELLSLEPTFDTLTTLRRKRLFYVLAKKKQWHDIY